MDVFGGNALEVAVGDIRQVVAAVLGCGKHKQHRTLLPSKKLADHGLRSGFENCWRDMADARSAGHSHSVAALDAFSMFARQLVGHLDDRLAAGAFDLNWHGETNGKE